MIRVKKASIFLATATLIFAISSVIFAADVIYPLEATVFVNQIFTMSATPLSIDFGSIDPAPSEIITTGEIDLSLSCETNNNNAWELSVWLTSPLTSGTFTIPNENFKWQGISANATGTWNLGGEYLDTIPHTFYSAGNNELITPSPIELGLRLTVDIPLNQAAGTYATTLFVKMKDAETLEEIEISLDVSVEVSPVLIISVEPPGLDFGIVDPGTKTGSEDLTLECSANSNNPWNVRIHVVSELTSGIFTIPNENFYWQSREAEEGQPGHEEAAISAIPVIFYNCGPDEYITSSPVELLITFSIDVPPTQRAGTYITTLVMTITE